MISFLKNQNTPCDHALKKRDFPLNNREPTRGGETLEENFS